MFHENTSSFWSHSPMSRCYYCLRMENSVKWMHHGNTPGVSGTEINLGLWGVDRLHRAAIRSSVNIQRVRSTQIKHVGLFVSTITMPQISRYQLKIVTDIVFDICSKEIKVIRGNLKIKFHNFSLFSFSCERKIKLSYKFIKTDEILRNKHLMNIKFYYKLLKKL